MIMGDKDIDTSATTTMILAVDTATDTEDTDKDIDTLATTTMIMSVDTATFPMIMGVDMEYTDTEDMGTEMIQYPNDFDILYLF